MNNLETDASQIKKDDKEVPYLAILLVIIDELPHEIIWRLWCEHYNLESGSSEQESTVESVRTDDTLSPTKESDKEVNEDNHNIANANADSEGAEVKEDSRDQNSDSVDMDRPEDDSATLTDGKKEIKESKDGKDADSTDNALINKSPDLPTSIPEKDVRTTPVRFFIHAKYPDRVRSKWVRDRLVPFNIRAGWGTVELTKIMVKLLEEVRLDCPVKSLPSRHLSLPFPLVLSPFLSFISTDNFLFLSSRLIISFRCPVLLSFFSPLFYCSFTIYYFNSYNECP